MNRLGRFVQYALTLLFFVAPLLGAVLGAVLGGWIVFAKRMSYGIGPGLDEFGFVAALLTGLLLGVFAGFIAGAVVSITIFSTTLGDLTPIGALVGGGVAYAAAAALGGAYGYLWG